MDRLSVDRVDQIEVVAADPPAVTGLGMNSNQFILTVTAGSAGAPWQLLTSTNLTQPVSEWSISQAGNLDGLGNLVLTNLINPAEPKRYFRVRLP